MCLRSVVVIVAVAALTASASAETRGTLRVGMLPLDLEASSDTPLFGSEVDRAVAGYNAAATLHDRQTGDRTDRIDRGDLGVAETLVVLSPGFEVGAGHYVFRMEAPIGIADDLRSIGIGMYPIGVQARLSRGVTAYASAGGTASYLDRPGTGDVGGLFTLRAAGGVRLSRFVVEVGYSAFALGGSINRSRLADMTEDDVMMELPAPTSIISAGEARGLVDVSLGVTF
jgi:hypothetical protein